MKIRSKMNKYNYLNGVQNTELFENNRNEMKINQAIQLKFGNSKWTEVTP